MCGRYWIAPEEENLEYIELLRVLQKSDTDIKIPSGLIVPTLPAPAITQQGIVFMQFGLRKEFLPRVLINARAETITEKPMFKKLFHQGQRCLLPASAFYEPSPDKKGRMYKRSDRGMMFMAGLYEKVGGLPQFVIITRDADEVVSPSHHRMPLLLGNAELRKIWLSNEVLAASLLQLDVRSDLLEMPAK
ncbi:MAG: SOS response-associated peptidase [Clostridiales bacterium]|nr:SOS response-associated peptidase [Clostridiales bacterium]